ncbi:hypothetical protein BH18ACT7_BH18ACT7_18570 [soil metagenome]
MIIVSGHLVVDPARRRAYLDATFNVARPAPAAAGCLDFVQVADPLARPRSCVARTSRSTGSLRSSRHNEPPCCHPVAWYRGGSTRALVSADGMGHLVMG